MPDDKDTSGTGKPEADPAPADAVPAEIEAILAGSVVVPYNGKDYIFPASIEDADAEVLEELEVGHLAGGLRALMGETQYKAFKKANRKVRDQKELFEAYAKLIGFDTGE